MDKDSSDVPDQLLEQLLKGYDALHVEFKLLNDQRRELENKLSWAKQQHLDAFKRFIPEKASLEHEVFIGELDEAGACQQNGQINWLDAFATDHDSDRRTRTFQIRTADDAREKLRARHAPEHEVKIWSHTNSSSRRSLRPHPLSSSVPLEMDFTTAGTPSKLGCPFATPGGRSVGTPRSSVSRMSHSRSNNVRSKRPSFHDPIRAEICGIDAPSPAPSASVAPSSAAACPIRFLDQHSPEEVAKYFENHKHELPRSHEVCIKRYQSNEESIRQLDAKYGNLVSMIQGLGAKHQPLLPDKEADMEDQAPAGELRDRDKVRSWAKAVSASLQNSDEKDQASDHAKVVATTEDRQTHFDRPLKDVRVGESPSRPWGITVPAKYQKAASAPPSEASAKSAPTASPRLDVAEMFPHPMAKQGEKKGRCPFDHKAFMAATAKREEEKTKLHLPPDPKPEPEPEQKPEPKTTQHSTFINPSTGDNANPKMIFNGPVFIGYSMEQAMSLLQQSGFGS
ncbi:hypothetical protein K402DRAFT_345496, partial [Aulographum hederae CBS 113979]